MKTITRIAPTLGALAAAALVLSACSGGGGSADSSDSNSDLTTLKVATIGLTSDGSLLTGIEQGFFEEEGLEIETSLVANPPAGLAAAQSGQVDLAYTPNIPIINALSQGIEMQVVAPADGFPDDIPADADPATIDITGLYAAPDSGITEVADLEGKTIAVPARNAQLEVTIADLLQEAGIDHKTGVNWVVLDFTSATSALQSGTVDAAGLVIPFTNEAEDNGAVRIGSPTLDFYENGATGFWAAGVKTIDEKVDAIAAFQRAVIKSNEYANEHPEEAIQAGLDYSESPLTVEETTVPYWPLELRQEDIDRPNEKLAALGFLAEPIDTSDVILPLPN